MNRVEILSRKEYFNEIAGSWENKYISEELLRFLGPLVQRFNIKLGYRVLDVGTGTGILIPFLVQAVGSQGSITAIDYAENMVKLARSNSSHFGNVKILLQDVEQLDVSPRSFDAVTCFGLFPHLDKKQKVLVNFNQALKRGGKLIIAHALGSKELHTHHHKLSRSLVASDFLPEKKEMTNMLKRAGFDQVFLQDQPGGYLCKSTKIKHL